MRRDRRRAHGPELFLLERAFEDCLERIALIQRRFERALLIGCPDPAWPSGSRAARTRRCARPGPLFAAAAGGDMIIEDAWHAAERSAYDLVVAIGTLDTRQRSAARAAPDPRRDARRCPAHRRDVGRRYAARSCAPRCARPTRSAGAAAPHVHPRIEPAALAPLLVAGGLRRSRSSMSTASTSAYPSLDAAGRRPARHGRDQHPHRSVAPALYRQAALAQPPPGISPSRRRRADH